MKSFMVSCSRLNVTLGPFPVSPALENTSRTYLKIQGTHLHNAANDAAATLHLLIYKWNWDARIAKGLVVATETNPPPITG
jgi:hypothetical protein